MIARALLDAMHDADPIAPLVLAHPDLDIAGAYAIQREGRRLREARGEVVVGHKIGLTSAAIQQQLGVDQPDFGYLTDTMLLQSGATLELARLIAPRVEAEIAFRLGRDLAGPGVVAADVLAACAGVAPALEVIDSRIAEWEITIVDTIADNASCGRVVLGAFQPLGELALQAVTMQLAVTTPGDVEQACVEGRGDAVLGHPAEAVAWLANELARHGDGLAAGEVVLSGALARALPIARGSRALATFQALGSVEVVAGGEAA